MVQVKRRLSTLLNRCSGNIWLPRTMALLGLLLYIAQAWAYAHTLESVLDEGAYLYKGWTFLTGKYVPFQDYGPLTNHMPLSFLLHGVIQYLFGPGLRTGRMFTLTLGVVMLVGLWLAARRQGGQSGNKLQGEWWGGAAVWIFALNPAVIKIYTLATSQVVIAVLMVWMLVCVLGRDRKAWQLILGVVFAGMMMLTRINLAPVLALLILYIIWQYGWRVGLLSTLVGLGVVTLGHVFWLPDILKIWAYWVPGGLSPFLDAWRQPEAARFWDPQITIGPRILSFWHGMRFHFLSMLVYILAVAWFPWKKDQRFPEKLFLLVLFTGLLVEHLSVSLVLSYCVFCFPAYMSFFIPVGILLLASVFPGRAHNMSRFGRVALAIALVIFTGGIGYGAYDVLGDALIRWRVPRLKTLISTGKFKTGLPFWDVIQTRFGIPYGQLERIVPLTLGLIVGLLMVLVGWLWARPSRKTGIQGVLRTTLLLAVIGVCLSPTLILGNGYRTYDCGGDVLRSDEEVGAYLADILPAGAQVYWKGPHSIAPLLHVPDIEIYPPQINGDYTLYDLEDRDTLLRFGLWSFEIAEDWINDTDYVLIEDRFYKGWYQDEITASGMMEVGITPPTVTCRPDALIHVFQRSND